MPAPAAPDFLSGYSPVFPVPLIAALAALAMGLALARALRGKRLRPAWLQGPVVLLRWAAVVVLAVILLNPSETVSLPQSGTHSAVLLDGSASMGLGAPEGPTRWREAAEWTAQYQAALASRNLPPAETFVFTTETHPVSAAAIPGFVPSAAETRLSHGLENLLHQAGSGGAVDHIIVISDGRAHDAGNLSTTLSAARLQNIPVSAKAVGSDTPPRNAALASVLAPRSTRARTRVTLPVEIETTGIRPNEPVILTLTDSEGAELARQDFLMPAVPPGTENQPQHFDRKIVFETGTHTGTYTLRLSGPAGEAAEDDNVFTFTTEVIGTKLRVLFVEGTHVVRSVGDSGHIFNDIELITKAWDATGEIEWDCLTPVSEYVDRPNLYAVKQFVNGEMLLDKTRTFPHTREEFFKYDVMLISDVPVGNFSPEQMQIVVDWVTERGGGFLMGGGYTSFDVGNYDKTPWEKIIPVDMLAYGDGFFEHEFAISIPESVRNHPIWQVSRDPEENRRILDSHPAFTGMNRVRRAKPGALVLAVRPEENDEPVIAAQSYGRGRSIAYLSDPNGGWARNIVSWGPPGGPSQGRHTELGHGENFIFHEDAARAAKGPMPPHPAPYYGQFWVNVAKWLGENSIRWRRDKMSGKILPAQAQPGRELPVSAEVLAVTKTDALLALDVGARLDIPGSPRVRLRYDRDRREFTGKVRVPADLKGSGVSVVFDTQAGREPLTDVVSAGLKITNLEYTGSAPDTAFLQQLAAAGGGTFLTTPESAAEASLAAAQARAARSRQTLRQPVWTAWPWWTALLTLLGLEWLLRRAGGQSAVNPQPPPVTV
ncbi:MAG: glutamine amidotransferase [Verrucomicrobiota bacterium]